MALSVHAHFVPSPKVLDQLAPEPTVDTKQRYLSEAVTDCRRLRDGLQPEQVVNQPTGC